MLALARLVVIGFVVLSVLYVVLSLWSRSVRRRKLLRQWEKAGRPGDRERFVEEGLAEYDDSIRRKLILGVYVVPVCIVVAIIYFTNFH